MQFQQILVLVLIILIVYFLIIRPQKKKQKEHQNMLDNLKVGDEIITNAGILGKISAIKKEKNIVSIKVNDNVKIDFLINVISSVISKKEKEIEKNEQK